LAEEVRSGHLARHESELGTTIRVLVYQKKEKKVRRKTKKKGKKGKRSYLSAVFLEANEIFVRR
jgi:hypothetical protein